MEQFFTIKEIAEKNHCSAKTVQNTINANPQLGVLMKQRKKTLLTYEQAAKVSALLDRKREQFPENFAENSEIPSISQNSGKKEKIENPQFAATENENTQFAELWAQIVELTERAAKAEGRAEELEKQVEDLKRQRERADEERQTLQGQLAGTQNLLESAEAKAARNKANLDEVSKYVFEADSAGFFAKGKKIQSAATRARIIQFEQQKLEDKKTIPEE